MKTIVIPLDGSPLAEQALPYAQLLAKMLAAKAHLLHVVSEADRYHLVVDEPELLSTSARTPDVRPAHVASPWEVLRQQAEAYLAPKAAVFQENGVNTEIDIRLGSPAETIGSVAAEVAPSLIVMATHGYSGLKRWALGSVTDKVVHTAASPVCVIRGSHGTSVADYQLKRILVPLDGSETARQALPTAVELATHAHAELILLSVVPPMLEVQAVTATNQPPRSFEAEMEDLRTMLVDELGALARDLQQEHVPVTPLVKVGYPPEIIVDEADTQANLIVMATHGYSGLKRWTLGSIADKVLHATKTPLILVRAQPGAD